VSLLFTDYLRNVVRANRPYLRDDWLIAAIDNPLRREVQDDGRIRL
jgi:hypothetical protein